jgi:Flp pilus assembly protein TadG
MGAQFVLGLRLRLNSARSRLNGVLRGDAGAVQIESAFCYLILFTLMFGIIQFCMMVYTYGVYSEAARVGVRYAVQHGSDSATCSGPTTGCSDTSGANVISAVNNYASLYVASISGMKVGVSYPDSTGSTPPSRVVVTVTYNYVPFINKPGFAQPFAITSQGRIEF